MKLKTSFIVVLFLFSVFLLSCSAEKLDRSADTPQEAMNFSLVRISQRTIRYCDNVLKSDLLEIIQDSSASVTLPTRFGFATDVKIENRTNGSGQPFVQSLWGGASWWFKINIAPTWLDLKVEQGLNQIHYEFVGTPNADSGDIYLDVKYWQETKPGTREIHMTPEECATPTPTPTPAL